MFYNCNNYLASTKMLTQRKTSQPSNKPTHRPSQVGKNSICLLTVQPCVLPLWCTYVFWVMYKAYRLRMFDGISMETPFVLPKMSKFVTSFFINNSETYLQVKYEVCNCRRDCERKFDCYTLFLPSQRLWAYKPVGSNGSINGVILLHAFRVQT